MRWTSMNAINSPHGDMFIAVLNMSSDHVNSVMWLLFLHHWLSLDQTHSDQMPHLLWLHFFHRLRLFSEKTYKHPATPPITDDNMPTLVYFCVHCKTKVPQHRLQRHVDECMARLQLPRTHRPPQADTHVKDLPPMFRKLTYRLNSLFQNSRLKRWCDISWREAMNLFNHLHGMRCSHRLWNSIECSNHLETAPT